MKAYINNKEAGRIELHFTKDEYNSLTAAQKAELKSRYLWSSYAQAWVSRSTQNHYAALQVAERLGFTQETITGERLSYPEQLEVKAGKAERRAERFEQRAANAVHKAEGLQAEFNSFRGDISFMTQPILTDHAGSQRFARFRDRITSRYEKGFDEYRKSEYYLERAATARTTADNARLTDRVYLNNRIEEANASIRNIQRKLNDAPSETYTAFLLDRMEEEIDKLSFFTNCLDEVGGITYNRDNIKPGYLIKVRGRWAKVEKANPKTITYSYTQRPLIGLGGSLPYAEVQAVEVPEGWTEAADTIQNPFAVGDIVTAKSVDGNYIIRAYQIIKASDKTVTLQRIRVENNTPLAGSFTTSETHRRTIKQTRAGVFAVNDEYDYLYKYAQ